MIKYIVFILCLLSAYNCTKSGKSASVASPASINYPDYPGAEEYSRLIEWNSLISTRSFFYAYIPALNVIGKYDLNQGRFEKLIDCQNFCGKELNLTIPENSQTLLLINQDKVKAMDMLTETFFDLPQLSIGRVDHYFKAAGGSLFGFLDRKKQEVNIYRGNSLEKMLTNLKDGSLVRVSAEGKNIIMVDAQNAEISIFVYQNPGYERIFTGKIMDQITPSPEKLGVIMDFRFTRKNEDQFLMITDAGYLLNFQITASGLKLLEFKTAELLPNRLNPVPGTDNFLISFWHKNNYDYYGIRAVTINEDNTLTEGEKRFFREEDNITALCRPIQIIYISGEERLIHCDDEILIYQNDLDPGKNTLIPQDFTPDSFNYSSVFLPQQKKILTVQNNFWGNILSFDLSTKKNEAQEDQFLKEFFR